jgi:predicted ATPase
MGEARFIPPESWRRAAADGVAAAAVLRPLTAPPPLPVPLTSLVGRADDLERLCGTLRSQRVVTVLGPGGSGKTRLALAAAGRAAGDEMCADGVWFADLAPLANETPLGPVIATLLGIRSYSADPLDDVIDRIVNCRLLLVLDNCEHVIEEAARLVERLASFCPGVRVLATSRERLGLAGEMAFAVEPLAVPQSSDLASLCEAEGYSAVELFLQRAKAASPGLTVADADASNVAQICIRLDGIPLALELAAARTPVLSLAELADGLENHFELLGEGWRTAAPRQRTLRATLDWSHDLLDPAEQALLRRIAVFSGTFTGEAASAVCATGPVATGAVLRLLGQLVAKSMLVPAGAGRTSRFRLLETIRQYGVEKLELAGEGRTSRDRHLAWFTARSKLLEADAFGAEAATALDQFELDHDNFLDALRWSGAVGDGLAGLQIAHDVFVFWSWRGLAREGLSWMERVLEDARTPSALAAAASRRCAILAYSLGEVDKAESLCASAIELSRNTDREELARSLSLFGGIAMNRGAMAEAEPLLLEGLALAREMGNDIWAADCLTHLGWWAQRQSRYDEAIGRAEELEAVKAENGYNRLRALEIRGYCDYEQARYELATADFLAMEEAAVAVVDAECSASALEGLGAVWTARGCFTEARDAYDRAVAMTKEHPDLPLMSAWAGLGELAAAAGRVDDARLLIEKSIEIARRRDDAFMLAWANLRLGAACFVGCLFPAARSAYEEAYATGKRFGMPWVRAGAAEGLAALASAEGRTAEALDLTQEAVALRRANGSPAPWTVRSTLSR